MTLDTIMLFQFIARGEKVGVFWRCSRYKFYALLSVKFTRTDIWVENGGFKDCFTLVLRLRSATLPRVRNDAFFEGLGGLAGFLNKHVNNVVVVMLSFEL